jgi:hypothetical protein
VASAPLERCPCASEDYVGKCWSLQKDKKAEPTCAGVDECIFHCAANDCGCIDACYAEKDACRTKASAVDGCVAEICDRYCR